MYRIVSLFFGLSALLVSVHTLHAQICPVTPGAELIVNGNFEAGNTGFTNSGLTYCSSCGTLGQDQYFVTTNPNLQNSGYFKNMADHTPGAANDKMIIYDFNNASQNDPIYSVNVNVVAGKVYFFSAWFANIAINNTTSCGTCPGGVYITNSPILKFKIAGVDQGIVHVDSLSNNWNQYFTTWSAATTTTITIEIVNLRGGMQSNDLALDDISFSDGCDKISNLNSIGQNSALIDTVKNCNIGYPFVLNPALPGSYGYSWRNSAGTLLTAPATNPTYSVASAPADGTKYYLCYEYIAGCPRMDSVIFKNTPLSVELGPNVVMCSPINVSLNSGATNPPVTIQWYKDGTPVATTGSYTATATGTYTVNLSRTGCGTASDNVVISNPVSTIGGSGLYCVGTGISDFTATGSSQIKWYTTPTGGSPLNPGNTNATISLPLASTNTTTLGCTSGLYAEDISSYPGALMPTAPCAGSNTSNPVDILINVTQAMSLTAVDFYHMTGWGATGTFTFSLMTNNPTSGPYCGGCAPAGNRDGVGTVIYTETTPSYTVGASNTVRTLTLATPQALTPGKYWLRMVANGTALGGFSGCDPARNTSDTWTVPVNDNTGNNVMQAIKGMINGGSNVGGSGGLFNIKFQVGNSNACSRYFICTTDYCPLPIELLSFSANAASYGNKLIWKTTAEINSSHFSIERSYDGSSFESIGTVKAAGFSSTLLTYSFIDKEASSEYSIVYYRLKEVDLDNTARYSTIVKVASNTTVAGMILYPQPVKQGNAVQLSFGAIENGEISIILFDVFGKEVFSKNAEVNEGVNTLEIPTQFLATGMYHSKLSGAVLGTCKLIIE